MPRYYEDLDVGVARELGEVAVRRDEVVRFAERYDPVPFHLDEDAGLEAGHDGIIASGFHTLALVNGVVVREYRRDVASVAGLGIEELRWPRPVRPGDTLTVTHEHVDKRPSESRPETGIVTSAIGAENEAGETVIDYRSSGVVKRRPDDTD